MAIPNDKISLSQSLSEISYGLCDILFEAPETIRVLMFF